MGAEIGGWPEAGFFLGYPENFVCVAWVKERGLGNQRKEKSRDGRDAHTEEDS